MPMLAYAVVYNDNNGNTASVFVPVPIHRGLHHLSEWRMFRRGVMHHPLPMVATESNGGLRASAFIYDTEDCKHSVRPQNALILW